MLRAVTQSLYSTLYMLHSVLLKQDKILLIYVAFNIYHGSTVPHSDSRALDKRERRCEWRCMYIP